MKVYAQFFFSGFSISYPSHPDFETYDSIKEAKGAFYCMCFCDPMTRGCFDIPTARMYLYFGEPAAQDCHPDRVLRIGPRGGVIVERG